VKTWNFTGEQIAFALCQAVAGTPVGEFCREMGMPARTANSASLLTCLKIRATLPSSSG